MTASVPLARPLATTLLQYVASDLQLHPLLCRDNAAVNREPSVPVSTSTGADPDRPGPPSQADTSTALVPLAGADEDEMMQDVAQMAGGAQAMGQDALTKLETTLRPIEKYAVRFLEMVGVQTSLLLSVRLVEKYAVRFLGLAGVSTSLWLLVRLIEEYAVCFVEMV